MIEINKNLKRDQDADVLSFQRTNGGVVVIPDADTIVLLDQCLLGIIIISTSTSQQLLLDEIDIGHARPTQVLQSLVGVAVAIVPTAIRWVVVAEDDSTSVSTTRLHIRRQRSSPKKKNTDPKMKEIC